MFIYIISHFQHGMATLSPESIEIEGEWHALDKIPDQKSAVVLREREKLLRAIGLKALVQDLGRIGGFICIAYNGAGAAGFKYTENQIEIQRLGYDITKLCDKSALTVAKFKKASSIILNDLQSTYEYLLDNLEEMAVHTFSNISDIAEEMQKAAEDLREEFEKEEKKIIEILENTQKTRQGAAEEIKELSMKRSQLESEKKQELQLIKEHQEKEREAEASRRELELQEDRAVSEIGELNPLKALVNVFTSVIAGVCVFSTDGAEKKAEAYRKKRLEALEAEQSIQEMRHEALAKMESFTAKIALCGEDQNMAECAVDALHEAAGALKHLSAVMMQAASFWEQMKDHCQSLAKKEMRSRVEEVLRYSEDKRLKVWTSKAFKRQAVQFCASWVALCAICIDYMEQIKQTKKDLYRYISENPTWEESRKNLQQLTKSFLSNLQQDQKALTDQEFRAQVEIKALEKQNLK